MNVGYRLFEGEENFNKIQLEMAIYCDTNGYHLEEGYEGGKRYLVVNPPYQPTLDFIKYEKIAELKKERDTLEIKDIVVDGYTFDYDDKARERINNAIIALQANGATINWTTADHQTVPVDSQKLIQVVSAVAERSNILHIAYRIAKQAVLDAETAEEIETISLMVD